MVNVTLLGGPNPSPLVAATEHEYLVSGVKPVTVSDPALEME